MAQKLSKEKRTVRSLAGQLFLSCLGISILMQGRPQIMLKLMKNDLSKTSARLAALTASAAAIEFLMNPNFGALSDAHGRSTFLLLSPVANLVLRLFVSLRPSKTIVSLEKIVTSVLLAVASITTQATLADISSGKDLALNSAKVGICAGLAFVVGPMTGGIIMKRFGPRAAYFAASVIAAVHILYNRWTFRETLAPKDRREMSKSFVSPFSFTRLLTTSNRSLKLLTVIGLLQTFCEPKTWYDMVQLYMRANVGLSASSLGRFFAAFGAMAIAAKAITRVVIKRKGFAFHTRMANLATAAAFVLWGSRASSKLTSVAAPLLLAPLFMDRRAGVTARANDAAVEAGFGKGEHAGLFGNLRALAVVFAPLLFGNLYSWSAARPGRPSGLPFVAAAAFAIAAEGVHAGLP